MIETFTALFFAHVLADFVLQTGYMVRRKRSPAVLALHTAIVLITAQAATGQIAAPELLLLAGVHLMIDAIKTYGNFNSLAAFMADQAAHLLTLVAIAAYAPALWASGAWAAMPEILPLMALTGGFIVATRAGGFAVGLLMADYSAKGLPEGLPHGGQLIGLLERGLVFVLVLVGQPAGIGFLIAAKSILRFDTASKDQKASEYVIIGTLASFGWALITAYGCAWLLSALPPLAFAPFNP